MQIDFQPWLPWPTGLYLVPATSAPSERVFSAAGDVVDKLRAALTAENVDGLVFLHKYAELLWR